MTAITLRDIVRGLYGAWRLARLDPGGMQYADSTVEGFWKSFFAAVLVLPVHIVLLMMTAAGRGGEAPGDDAPFLYATLLKGIVYVIDWVAFPLIMAFITEAIGRRHNYIPFIVIGNWAAVIQVTAILPAAAFLVATGGSGVGVLIYITVWSAVAVYAWYIARTALDISGLKAALIVFLDLLISFILAGLEEATLRAAGQG